MKVYSTITLTLETTVTPLDRLYPDELEGIADEIYDVDTSSFDNSAVNFTRFEPEISSALQRILSSATSTRLETRTVLVEQSLTIDEVQEEEAATPAEPTAYTSTTGTTTAFGVEGLYPATIPGTYVPCGTDMPAFTPPPVPVYTPTY